MLTFKVAEAESKDVGRAIVRLDPKDLSKVKGEVGDFVEITHPNFAKGKTWAGKAVAKLMPCFEEKRGKGIVQMDGILRENVKVGLDEKVRIKKIQLNQATAVVLKPLTSESSFKTEDSEYLAQLLDGTPVIKGNKIRVTFFGSRFQDFEILDTEPARAVLITPETLIKIRGAEKSAKRGVGVTYEDIGGLKKEVGKIREMIELPLKYPEVFERLGIDAPKGVLLHGPPGTGKTLIAKAVANESDANFYHMSGPECMAKFYGESEARLREAFEEAKANAPAILVIDEIDAIAPKREEMGGEKQVEKRVVATLLAEMDGLESRGDLIVIGITNIPNTLDPALRRPGRFDREISISIPDKLARKEILEIHTRGMPLSKNVHPHTKRGQSAKGAKKGEASPRCGVGVDLEKLAEITHGFVGADLEALCREAAMSALRKIMPEIELEKEYIPYKKLLGLEVTMEHFQEALKEVEPSALREVFTEIPDIKWEDVGGLENIKQSLRETIEWPLKYPELFEKAKTKPAKGILLYGKAGTGKTLLAKAVASQCGVNFISVKGPELLSRWVGESIPSFEKIHYLNDNKFHSAPMGKLVEEAPLEKNIQVLSFTKDGTTSFNKVSDFIKHNKHSHIYKVTTQRGMSIHVTKDHSLFIIGENGIGSIRTQEIVPNKTYIALPGKIQSRATSSLKSFNLIEMFADSELRVYGATEYIRAIAKEVGYKAVTKALGKHRRKLLDDLLYRQLAPPISRFLEISKLSKNKYDISKIKVGLNGSKIPAVIPITNTLLEALGLWVAEGDINQGELRIANSDKECIKVFKKLANQLGINCGIYRKKGTEDKAVRLLSKPLALLVQKLNFQCGAPNKNVPSFIHDLDRNLIASFLRGYFSGDGGVSVAEKKVKTGRESGYDAVEATTVSKELAHGASMLLRYFGIVPTIWQRTNRLGHIEYIVKIFGVNNYKIFADQIEFLQPSKQKKLSQNITKRKWSRGNILPVTGVVYDFVREHMRWRKNPSIDKLTLIKRLNRVDPEGKHYHSLRTVLTDGIYWDKVISIKKVKYNGYVYDLSVKDNQNFVSGFGGVFAHNSERGIREVFKKARQASPCIIAFDEIEGLVPKRSSEDSSGVSQRVVSQFLSEMDGLEELKEVVVIGTTNRLDLVDSALLRAGRFDFLLEVPKPDEKARLEIFKIHTRGKPLAKDVHPHTKRGHSAKGAKKGEASPRCGVGVNLGNLARETEGLVGSDIEAICKTASMLAIREFVELGSNPGFKDNKKLKINSKHFQEALQNFTNKI